MDFQKHHAVEEQKRLEAEDRQADLFQARIDSNLEKGMSQRDAVSAAAKALPARHAAFLARANRASADPRLLAKVRTGAFNVA